MIGSSVFRCPILGRDIRIHCACSITQLFTLVENCPRLGELINNQLDMAVLADAIEQVESILPKDTAIAPR
jgi:hypothetical protein